MKKAGWWLMALGGVMATLTIGCDEEPTPEPTGGLTFEERMTRDVDSLREILPQRIDSLREVHNDATLEWVEDTSGVFFVIYEEGSGPLATKDDIAFTYYRGSLLNRIVFDSNLNSLPFQFTVGGGGVIVGWNRAILQFREGTKAYVYIPSPLAYGVQSRGGIPANAILVFNMELVELR